MNRLTRDEAALWAAWNRAVATVRAGIAADTEAETTLSETDFAILTRVLEIGGGRTLRRPLANLLELDPGFLSRQLNRMRERGLMVQKRGAAGLEVVATDDARALVKYARPHHVAAVHRHFIDPLTGVDIDRFRLALELLGS